MLLKVSVKVVTKDGQLSMENVFQLILLIVIKRDVRLGKMENVLNVQKDGSSTLTVFVKKLVIFAGLGQTMENAKAAIKGT